MNLKLISVTPIQKYDDSAHKAWQAECDRIRSQPQKKKNINKKGYLFKYLNTGRTIKEETNVLSAKVKAQIAESKLPAIVETAFGPAEVSELEWVEEKKIPHEYPDEPKIVEGFRYTPYNIRRYVIEKHGSMENHYYNEPETSKETGEKYVQYGYRLQSDTIEETEDYETVRIKNKLVRIYPDREEVWEEEYVSKYSKREPSDNDGGCATSWDCDGFWNK